MHTKLYLFSIIFGMLFLAQGTQAAEAQEWTWPTETTAISAGYSAAHQAIDIDGETGDDVYAAHSGRVKRADCKSPRYGCMVIIQHKTKKNTWRVRYSSLEKVTVQKGDRVDTGQIIGYIGSTGRSTGSHLHFEIRKRHTQFISKKPKHFFTKERP